MLTCSLCRADLGPILAESAHWRLVLNLNQNLLGKCMLVLRRHLERVPELNALEWSELHSELGRAVQRLDAAFRPDHYNYAFLQNQDRHVHLHIIPRYAAPRTFDGLTFEDPDWPGHYTPSNPPRRLSEERLTALAEYLRRAAVGVPSVADG